ncbi:MAG: guanylate kinase [Lentisphaeraceae bacterium]|nr:guanylate kinase [Lentisphaeraceae bacterium]
MSTSYKHFSSLGVALFVSGPSGAGKTTVCDQLLERKKDLHFSISCTTREPRKGEIDGEDYYFISVKEFKEKVENDEFLEYAEVHDNYYGTLKTEVTDKVSQGNDVLIDIDVQGMKQIKEAMIGNDLLQKTSTFVFIAPPSYSELEARLRKRATETESTISKRLLNARKELKAWNLYTYLIINDEVEKAVNRLLSVMEAVCIRTERLEPVDEWPYV